MAEILKKFGSEISSAWHEDTGKKIVEAIKSMVDSKKQEVDTQVPTDNSISRRDFLKMAGAVTGGWVLSQMIPNLSAAAQKETGINIPPVMDVTPQFGLEVVDDISTITDPSEPFIQVMAIRAQKGGLNPKPGGINVIVANGSAERPDNGISHSEGYDNKLPDTAAVAVMVDTENQLWVGGKYEGNVFTGLRTAGDAMLWVRAAYTGDSINILTQRGIRQIATISSANDGKIPKVTGIAGIEKEFAGENKDVVLLKGIKTQSTPTSTTIALTATPGIVITPTTTEAPTKTPEIQNITFTNTDGVSITMPEFTGPDAAQNAMNFLSKNALWVTGDFRSNDWFTFNNRDAVKVAKPILKIPGYDAKSGDVYPHSLSDPKQSYIDFNYNTLGTGTVIFFQDQQKNTKVLYIDGVTAENLSGELQSGSVSVPTATP